MRGRDEIIQARQTLTALLDSDADDGESGVQFAVTVLDWCLANEHQDVFGDLLVRARNVVDGMGRATRRPVAGRRR